MDKSNKIIKIAVFDIDRTLLPNTSVEIQLIRYLYRKKIIKGGEIIKSIAYTLSSLPKGINEVIYRKSSYLQGIEKEKIISQLYNFFDHFIWPRVSRVLLKYIAQFKRENFKIVIISGTLDFLVKPFIERLGIDGGMGSHLNVNNGKFLPRISGIYPYKYGKIEALHYYFEGQGIDYSNSYAFADSRADIPLLQMFGNPVVVNPSPFLWLKAKLKSWKIIKV